MKQVRRPSEECLKELELSHNQPRVDSLQAKLKDFLIDGAKYAAELKAYQKILADAERNSRSDPNNELWLSQLEEKTKRHQLCLGAIDSLLLQTVQAIDQHSRSEAVSIIRSLVNDGFFDKPLTGKNSLPSSSTSTTAATSIMTIQKGLENEQKEREDAIKSLRDQFEEYREFNNKRFTEFHEKFDNYKQTHDTRLNVLVEHHRKEINSLKAGYQLNQMKNLQKSTHPPTPTPPPPPPTQAPIDQEQLKPFILQQVQEELAKQLNNRPTDPNHSSPEKLIDDIRAQLDQLTQLTTATLQEVEPEIKRVTQSIQTEVIKSSKTVITNGHEDISALIQEIVTKIQEQVDELKPIINKSSLQIQQVNSNQETFQTKINEQLESKVKEISDHVGTIESKSVTREDLSDFITVKQINALEEKIQATDTKSSKCKDQLSKSIDQCKLTLRDTSSQSDENKALIKKLLERVETVEKSMADVASNRRYSTPVLQPNYPTHLQHQSSQTPPSPATSRRMSQPGTTASPSTGYHQYHGRQEPVQQPAQIVNNYHSQSQNIPIASRLTSAPSVCTSTSSGPYMNNNPNNHHNQHNNYKGKQPRSREPSLAISNQNLNANHNGQTQQQLSAGGNGMNGGVNHPNNKGGYNQYQAYSSAQEYQEDGMDSYQMHQQHRYSEQSVPVVNNQQATTTHSLPLAKRLKTDFKNHYHPTGPTHENKNNNKSRNNPLMTSLAVNNPGLQCHPQVNSKKLNQYQQPPRRN